MLMSCRHRQANRFGSLETTRTRKTGSSIKRSGLGLPAKHWAKFVPYSLRDRVLYLSMYYRIELGRRGREISDFRRLSTQRRHPDDQASRSLLTTLANMRNVSSKRKPRCQQDRWSRVNASPGYHLQSPGHVSACVRWGGSEDADFGIRLRRLYAPV